MEQHKEKLEEAKKLYESANNDQKYVLENLFPELKESEDEVIKKKVIALVKSRFVGLPQGEKYVAWLEKQGESDETKAKMFLIKKGYPIDANGTFPTYKEMCNIIRERLKKIAETCVTICDPDAYRIGFADGEAHAKEEKKQSEQKPSPFSGVSFKYNGRIWRMYAKDDGVEITMDDEPKAFTSFKRSFIYPTYYQPVPVRKSASKEAAKEEKVDNANKVEPKDYNSIDPHFGKPAAFIEKAAAWLEEHKEAVETEDNGIMGWIPDYFIEDFRKYMKGE